MLGLPVRTAMTSALTSEALTSTTGTSGGRSRFTTGTLVVTNRNPRAYTSIIQ